MGRTSVILLMTPVIRCALRNQGGFLGRRGSMADNDFTIADQGLFFTAGSFFFVVSHMSHNSTRTGLPPKA